MTEEQKQTIEKITKEDISKFTLDDDFGIYCPNYVNFANDYVAILKSTNTSDLHLIMSHRMASDTIYNISEDGTYQ